MMSKCWTRTALPPKVCYPISQQDLKIKFSKIFRKRLPLDTVTVTVSYTRTKWYRVNQSHNDELAANY